MSLRLCTLLSAAIVVAVGCRSMPATLPASIATSTSMTRTEITFGLARPDGGPVITDAEFDTFVEADVVPRLPDGFTLVPARGHWRGPSGVGVSEPSRVLIVVAPRTAGAAIDAICRRYREQFQQEAVLRIDAPATVTFVTTRPADPK